MIKKVLIIFLFLFLINLKNINATDEINIVCKKENCINKSKIPIFNEKDIYPGLSINKKIKIINETESLCNISFKLIKEDVDLKLSEKIFLKFNEKNYRLDNIFDNQILLGKLNPNYFKVFDLSYFVDIDTDNNFQNKDIYFNANFEFTCEKINGTILGKSTELNSADFIIIILFLILALLALVFLILLLKRKKSDR